MRAPVLAIAVALAAVGGCSKTESGDIVVKRPTSVNVQTTPETLRLRTRTETVNAPTIGTEQETVIVKKPVIGTTKRAVKVPTVQQP
jgi:hypothetical protein